MTGSKKIRWLLALAATALTGAAILLFIFSGNRSNGISPGNLLPDPKVMMSLSNVHQTAIKDGRTQWELNASEAKLLDGGKTMELAKPEVGFFGKDGTQVMLQADRGRLNLETNDITVFGHVLIDDSRYKLSTEQVEYKHKGQLLICNRPVQISGPGIQIKAREMNYDLKTNIAEFKGRVEGVLIELPAI